MQDVTEEVTKGMKLTVSETRRLYGRVECSSFVQPEHYFVDGDGKETLEPTAYAWANGMNSISKAAGGHV